MELIFQKMLERAIKDLETLQRRELLSFKIYTADGDEYGDMEMIAEEEKPAKRRLLYPHGEVRQYYMNYVGTLKPDEIVSIPFGNYDAESIRGNLCAWATTVWGKGSYTSTVNRDKSTVDIYRHAA